MPDNYCALSVVSAAVLFNSLCLPLVNVKVTETTDRIDMEKLKAREHIMFFDEVLLFEDELHDHGVSMLSVKIVSAFCHTHTIV